MSHKNYSEYEPSDQEIEDLLDELYPEPVEACGMEFSQSYILKNLDRVAFDMFGSDSMNWFTCDICGKLHQDDDAEESARECCQRYCDECGKELDDDPQGNSSDLCDDCQALEDEEFEEDSEEVE